MPVLRWVAFAVGVVVAAATAAGVLASLVVPRGRSTRLSSFNRATVRGLTGFLAGRFRQYPAQDRVLTVTGPLALLSLFVAWLLLFLVAFSLMLSPFTGDGFWHDVRQAGSSLLTLGLASSPRALATAVDYAAGATGLFVVALEIAYLPTIYGAFNRRETLVTLLESRAGVPAWGPEILARHELVEITDSLPAFYAAWEQWAADVAESHTNYPSLVLFRSPHPLRSWVVGLIAVLDSAAMYLSLSPSAAPAEARLCLRMGFTMLREVARVEGIAFEDDPMPDRPIRLTYEEFAAGCERVAETGFRMERSPQDAWPHFRGWRVNYEATAYALAERTYAVPAPWSGTRRRLATITPRRPADRTPEDPSATRHGGRWLGPTERVNRVAVAGPPPPAPDEEDDGEGMEPLRG